MRTLTHTHSARHHHSAKKCMYTNAHKQTWALVSILGTTQSWASTVGMFFLFSTCDKIGRVVLLTTAATSCTMDMSIKCVLAYLQTYDEINFAKRIMVFGTRERKASVFSR